MENTIVIQCQKLAVGEIMDVTVGELKTLTRNLPKVLSPDMIKDLLRLLDDHVKPHGCISYSTPESMFMVKRLEQGEFI